MWRTIKSMVPAMIVDTLLYVVGIAVLPGDISYDDPRVRVFEILGYGTALYAAFLVARVRSVWLGIGYGILFWFVWKSLLFATGSLGGLMVGSLDLGQAGLAIAGYAIAQASGFPFALVALVTGALTGMWISRRRNTS